ncbi:hypothetical protein K435DRAFT_61195 [Dendrothele bispora CBS 962.96]|uniref:Uncharacterized protein n=1 Tax=Dendrothele bispora (strain CBS 962.96) TaxID=1314807 RepID=A0A4S8KRC3_DENBC|nr:hypothetical protein K435DRAFT_61195 [Dendrothele bispora CBS 962.96]
MLPAQCFYLLPPIVVLDSSAPEITLPNETIKLPDYILWRLVLSESLDAVPSIQSRQFQLDTTMFLTVLEIYRTLHVAQIVLLQDKRELSEST